MAERARSDAVVKAAGAVLWRRGPDDAVEVALVHRPHRQDWTFPKGKLEPGEPAVCAAVREVEEETGYRVALGRPLPTRRYLVDGQRKRVRYWLSRADEPPTPAFAPGPEVDELVWEPLPAARERLSYPHDAELLDAVERGPLDTVPLVVLRHAKALKRARWDGPDDDRPLEPRGEAQAQRMVPLLAAYGIRRVHSSDTERCRASVWPYAKSHGLDLEDEHDLSENGYQGSRKHTVQRSKELLAEPEPLVLCTHRPVLPEVVRALLDVRKNHEPRPLPPAGFLVLHRDLSGTAPRVVAVERHRT